MIHSNIIICKKKIYIFKFLVYNKLSTEENMEELVCVMKEIRDLLKEINGRIYEIQGHGYKSLDDICDEIDNVKGPGCYDLSDIYYELSDIYKILKNRT